MNKNLFTKLSNKCTEVGFAKSTLFTLETERDEIKREFLQSLYDEVIEEKPFFKLLWEVAVEMNYGMDVSFDNCSEDEIVKYIRAYSKQVYCFNLDNIYLSDEAQEAAEEE